MKRSTERLFVRTDDPKSEGPGHTSILDLRAPERAPFHADLVDLGRTQHRENRSRLAQTQVHAQAGSTEYVESVVQGVHDIGTDSQRFQGISSRTSRGQEVRITRGSFSRELHIA